LKAASRRYFSDFKGDGKDSIPGNRRRAEDKAEDKVWDNVG
jgi:hypothetical protein